MTVPAGAAVPARLAGRSGMSVVAKLGTLGLQTVQFAMLARALDQDTFAALTAGTALLVILGALAEFGLVNASVLALADAAGDASAERRVVGATLRASALMVGVSLAAAALSTGLLFRDDARLAVVALIPWFVLSRIDVGFLADHQFHLRTTRLAISDLASRAVLVAATVPFLLDPDWSAQAALAAVGLGFFLSEVVSLAVLAWGVRWRGAIPRGQVRALLRRAVPIGFTNASSVVHARSDQVVLDAMGRRPGLAAYAVAYRINEALLALVNSVGAISFAVLARSRGEERRLAAHRFATLGCVAATAASVSIFVAAPQIVTVLGGDRYASSSDLARLLVPALAVSMANLPIAQVVIVAGGAPRLFRFSVASVVVNLALTAALVSQLDAKGAALATSITETVGFLAVAWLASREVRGSVPWLPVLLVPLVAGGATWGSLGIWRSGHEVLAGAILFMALVGTAIAGASAASVQRS